MRIACPNCGAQYEVPDEVIPAEGRDVQCSNCGDTWFQHHADHNPEAAPAVDLTDDSAAADDVAEQDSEPPEPSPRPLDQDVTDILREEAERETRLRDAEASPLESQTEMGLDNTSHDDEVARRTREARERMARMRGESPEPQAPPEEEIPDTRPRSRLLPDIEETNSNLEPDEQEILRQTALDIAVQETSKKGGFSRGFVLVIALFAGLVILYSNGTKISASIPAIEPVLTAYVEKVDGARIWLDNQLSGFIPK